jgi:hypothetical protein
VFYSSDLMMLHQRGLPLVWVVYVTVIFLLSLPSQTHAATEATYEIKAMPETVTENDISSGLTAIASVNSVVFTQITDSEVITDSCPAGSYSETDSSTCSLCTAGKYSSSTSATGPDACIACDSGTYSTAIGAISDSTCTACLGGTYFDGTGGDNEEVCQQCPENSNSYASSKSISSCVCDPGYSGPNGGPCSACGTGVWCLNGQSNQCPLNSDSSALSSELSQCLCRPGYSGDTTLPTPNSATLCQFCREGFYCPGGSVNLSLVCPNSTYSAAGSDDPLDCACPPNSISKQRSATVTECVCQPGFYKEFNSLYPPSYWWCRPCVPGEFCYDNANKTCPAHSVSLGVAKSVLDCFCIPGYMNATIQTEHTLCVDCPSNSYCTGKGHVSQCVPNAVSPVQSKDATKCYCDWGWKGLDNSECVACETPTFCYGGIEAQCSEGTFSEPLSWDRTNCSCIPGRWGPRGGPCIKCTAGKYNLLPGCVSCTNLTDSDCVKCAAGSASSVEGRDTTCDVCPNGTYSGPAGSTECMLCPNGTYSLGNAETCTKCPLGWWAAEGSVECTPCPLNTYLELEGQGSESSCTPCPEGTISTRLGNSDPACSACSPGSYQLEGVCVLCPPGSFSKTAAISCKSCLAGTYSAEGATSCTDCDIGMYSSSNNSAGCVLCGSGSYSEFTGQSGCTPCAPGFFVEYDGAERCTRCKYGEYAAGGASSVSVFIDFHYLVNTKSTSGSAHSALEGAGLCLSSPVPQIALTVNEGRIQLPLEPLLQLHVWRVQKGHFLLHLAPER